MQDASDGVLFFEKWLPVAFEFFFGTLPKETGLEELAIQLGDGGDLDAGGAGSFAFVGIGATAESFFVHLCDHAFGSLVSFGLPLRELSKMGHLGGDKEHGGGVFTGGHAGPATDASGRIHGSIRARFADQQAVSVLSVADVHRGIASRGNDAVKSGAVHH